jgi:hypothetical protein
MNKDTGHPAADFWDKLSFDKIVLPAILAGLYFSAISWQGGWLDYFGVDFWSVYTGDVFEFFNFVVYSAFVAIVFFVLSFVAFKQTKLMHFFWIFSSLAMPVVFFCSFYIDNGIELIKEDFKDILFAGAAYLTCVFVGFDKNGGVFDGFPGRKPVSLLGGALSLIFLLSSASWDLGFGKAKNENDFSMCVGVDRSIEVWRQDDLQICAGIEGSVDILNGKIYFRKIPDNGDAQVLEPKPVGSIQRKNK